MINKKDLFPIGIGTWGLGGFAERNPDNDDKKQIEALKHMLDSGLNYVNICPWNSDGKAVELLSEALRQSSRKRKDLFLSASIYHYRIKELEDIDKEINRLYKAFNTDYMDSILFLFNGIQQWGIQQSIDYMNNKLLDGTSRYVSISNSDLKTLKLLKNEFKDKLFAHEVQFNFEIRYNYDENIIKYASDNDILNVIYQPIRRNRTVDRNWPLLVELSKKYNKSQNQIIMNWLILNKYLPITKSENIEHIDELIGSMDFEIEDNDIKRLNDFRPPNFTLPKVSFIPGDNSVVMHQLSNVFDEEYDKQRVSD